MQMQEYVCPATIEEAYEILKQGKNNWVIGGCTFLHKINRKIKTGIDLKNCGLSYIKEDDDSFLIGAYTPLRDIETSEALNQYFGSCLREVMEHLIGVQLRNQITIGGHMASRFGFSDINALMIALCAKVRFQGRGVVDFNSYMTMVRPEKDILVEVILPKNGQKTSLQMMRLSYNDYSIFSMAVTKVENRWRFVAGVLPGRAKLYEVSAPIAKDQAAAVGEEVSKQFTFGSNFRGSAEYRADLCRTFAKRAVEELA